MTPLSHWINKAKKLRPGNTLFPAGHFYSPYPDLNDIDRRRSEIFDRSKKHIPGIDLRATRQIELVRQISTEYYDQFPYPTSSGNLRFNLDNGAFSYCDAVTLYGMLREVNPDRVVEIGSGYSSALMLDTNEKFLDDSIDFTFIEPFPQLLESLIRPGDLDSHHLVDTRLHEVDRAVFAALRPGDILFVDSTHVSKAGSDVNQIFFEILPALKAGTYIHLHDIFFPFEYPEEWVRETRAWNEDYLVRAFLQNNPNYEIVLFNNFLGIHHRNELEELLPLAVENDGGSLWLRKVRDG